MSDGNRMKFVHWRPARRDRRREQMAYRCQGDFNEREGFNFSSRTREERQYEEALERYLETPPGSLLALERLGALQAMPTV